MTIRATHDLHRRRLSRNVGVGLVLFAFIFVIFGLTVAKVQTGVSMEAFDHTVRPSITVSE
jgi:hypothetical protein